MINDQESSTLKNLESAIRAHVQFMFEQDGTTDVRPVLTGWLVSFEVQLIEDGTLVYDNGYAVGETTTPNTSVGLAISLSDHVREVLAEPDEEDDE